MARASAPSVPRATPAHQPLLPNRLRRWLGRELRQLRPAVAASAARCEAERYRKHFDAFAHACLLLFHGLTGSPSLRQSFATFAACSGLVALSGLADSPAGGRSRLRVSFSQFAASNTSRPAAFLGGLVPLLVRRVRALGPPGHTAPPPDLHVLDSTFLRLSLHFAPWLPSTGGADVPGVRVQLRYAPAPDLPEHVLVTDTRTSDCRGLDQTLLDDPAQLAALRGQTLVIDLGYYSHRRFARLRAAGIHFISRLRAGATVQVTAEQPVQARLPGLEASRITVHRDQQVTVGSPNNHAGAVLPGLRLITATVAPQPAAARRGAQPLVYRVLTDRWDLPAHEVVQLYLWRWHIELFFRWLKSFLHLPRLLGYSRNAVELTIWLAIVVHLLTVLAAHALGLARRSPALLRWFLVTLVQLRPADTADPTPVQLALPGWSAPLGVPP